MMAVGPLLIAEYHFQTIQQSHETGLDDRCLNKPHKRACQGDPVSY
jgi:hypothetical protein